MEQWTSSPLYPGYEASTLGRVRSITGPITQKSRAGRTYVRHMRGKILEPSVVSNGYVKNRARRSDKTYETLAHRIIYEIFFGKIQKGLTINHKNGVKHDNRPENLEACSSKENIAHAYRIGLIVPRPGRPRDTKNGRFLCNPPDLPLAGK